MAITSAELTEEEPVNDDKRRKAVLALAVGAPAAWCKPVVDSVILPAHAKSSGQCSAPSGCYNILEEGEDELSFVWPGGQGPHVIVTGYDGFGCSSSETFPGTETVIAQSMTEALQLLSCNEVFETTSANLPDGCSFWSCE